MSTATPRSDGGLLKTILECPEDAPSTDSDTSEPPTNMKRHGSFKSLNDYIDGEDELNFANTDSDDAIDEFSKDGRVSRLSVPKGRRENHGGHRVSSRRHRQPRDQDASRECWNEDVLGSLSSKLEKKYAELSGLIAQQFSDESSRIMKQQAKQLVKQFTKSSRGMPTKPPVTLTYVPDPISPRSDCGTQTEEVETLDDSLERRSSSRSEKRVSFAPQPPPKRDDSARPSSARHSRQNYVDDGYDYRGVLKKSRETFHGKKFIARVKREDAQDVGDVEALQKARLRNAQRNSQNKSKSERQSRAPSPRKDNTLKSYSADDVRTAMSDNGKNKSEYRLKDTDDPMILGWIHRKKVEEKRKRREKREKRKVKREQRLEEAERREKRKEEATVAMDNWLQEKHKEVLLLKKRARLTKQSFKNSHNGGETSQTDSPNNVEAETSDATPKIAPEETASAKPTTPTKLSPRTKSPRVSPKGCEDASKADASKADATAAKPKGPQKKCKKSACEEALRCTCGYMEAKKMREYEDLQREQARKARLRARSASPTKSTDKSNTPPRPNSSASSRPSSNAKSPMNNSNNKNDKCSKSMDSSQTSKEEAEKEKEKESRMSYDQWLDNKRKQDIENRNKLEKAKQERANKSDPDLAKVIPDIARKRVDNILNGKKKIDTGIKEVDSTANAYPSRPSSAPPSRSPPSETQNKYQWKEQSSSENGDSNQSTTPSRRPARPQTAKVRPASARPNFGRPTPPRSASSPTPRSQIENITHTSDNPFKIPFPPSPKKPSRLHEQGFRGRKFATHVWDSLQDEERPEPQGSDNPHPVPHHDRYDDHGHVQSTKSSREFRKHSPTEKAGRNEVTERALVPRVSDEPSGGAFMTSLALD